MKRRTKTES